MKTAIYIDDGNIQLVLTPQSEFEKNALTTFRDRNLEVKIVSGSFYECTGGWVRNSIHNYSECFNYNRKTDTSLILSIKDEPKDANV